MWERVACGGMISRPPFTPLTYLLPSPVSPAHLSRPQAASMKETSHLRRDLEELRSEADRLKRQYGEVEGQHVKEISRLRVGRGGLLLGRGGEGHAEWEAGPRPGGVGFRVLGIRPKARRGGL